MKFQLLIIAFLFISCKNDNNLVEVQIPEPEVIDQKTSNFGDPNDVKTETGPFELVQLNYKFEDFVPNLDGRTIETHYSKHLLGHANKLNKIVTENKWSKKTKIEDILLNLDINNLELRKSAGGYYNHNLFFENLAPKSNLKPSDTLTMAIDKNFGSFEAFKQTFIATASNVNGSGWTWLILNKKGDLEIITTVNNDNPLMKDALIKGTPLFNIDTWEHAYYLQYQNRKLEYLKKVFELLNWDLISKKFESL
ncbi:superoxide dismutase [Flavobacterium sp.]|jgi:Fe-Mn family superoxide dismutase|uniref:superoxide dismutase n=1 Tax=Flavobacterium sp. TaxID=239 RepID=UPI002A82078D|nr:superoxide dismutase [Flavobacterium sp.]